MNNTLILQIASLKIDAAFGPGEFPSSEEISNANWLSK